ncbi:hypothetical protein DVH24_026024 [Malus domestica]|uniref:Uncharacterized protein n=1 Tax=Malus domestica TaxID=3750 RepID=A0A498KGS1_MALDO|nr:hypothetical protein DVH24_026024 [Malus domestica]
MNALFDGHVNLKTTMKQLVEQYENALKVKVEKKKQDDFKLSSIVFNMQLIIKWSNKLRRTYCDTVSDKVNGTTLEYQISEVIVNEDKNKKIKRVYFKAYYFGMRYMFCFATTLT